MKVMPSGWKKSSRFEILLWLYFADGIKLPLCYFMFYYYLMFYYLMFKLC